MKHATVGDLIDVLSRYPRDLPVVVTGCDSYGHATDDANAFAVEVTEPWGWGCDKRHLRVDGGDQVVTP